MNQQTEVLKMCSMMLYYYYLSYKRLPLILNQFVLNQFTNVIIQQFKQKFPTFTEETPIDSFILFDKPFDELHRLEDDANLFSNMMNALISFPRTHHLIIRDDYCILSLLPIPFDSLDIYHGMIINYFTPILDTKVVKPYDIQYPNL